MLDTDNKKAIIIFNGIRHLEACNRKSQLVQHILILLRGIIRLMPEVCFYIHIYTYI